MIGIILQPLASSEAVLSEDERELGVAMIDMGGGTTDLAIFAEGSVMHTAIIPVGGDHFTNDIAVGLKTARSEAERLKVQFGCAVSSLVKDDEISMYEMGTGRSAASRASSWPILSNRAPRSCLISWRGKLSGPATKGCNRRRRDHRRHLLMEGMPDMAERILDLPARRGLPAAWGDPRTCRQSHYSTSVD